VPEGDYRDRLVKRLRKAGFTEVEPTLTDKLLYEKTQRLRSLSPDANMDVLQEVLRELAAERLMKEDTTGEKVAKFIEELIDFLIALFSPVAREETKREGSPPEAA
jgi:hypothetical protein